MSESVFSLKFAALPVAISALLHLFAFVPDGVTASSAAMLLIGIIYLLLAMGLRRNLRWVAWLTFLVMTFGAVAAYMVSGGSALHNAWFLAIALIDCVAAMVLFVCLWRPAQQNHGA